MENKRQSNTSQGPKHKIRKIVHLTSSVEQMLKSKELMERVQVHHNGNHVYVSLMQQEFPMQMPDAPRSETRPKPIRPAGR